MKKLAVVYWIEKGIEHSSPFFTQAELNRFTRSLTFQKLVHWTCLCDPSASVPFKPPKRVV